MDSDLGIESPEYKQTYQNYGSILSSLSLGFNDFYLISLDGTILYSNNKHSDLGKTLETAETGLARAFKKVIASEGKDWIEDFSLYEPSKNLPSMFLATPLKEEDGTFVGVVAGQLLADEIISIMGERTGLGETGETLLADKRMRSDSYLDKKHRSTEESLSGTPEKNGIESEDVLRALDGVSGAMKTTDYRGKMVLSVFSPVKIHGIFRALLAKIDEEEALKVTGALIKMVSVIALISLLGIALLAVSISRSITSPIFKAIAIANRLADGVRKESAERLAPMSGRMGDNMKKVQDKSIEIVDSAGQVSTNLNTVAHLSEDVSVAVKNVSTAIENMKASFSEVSKNCSKESDIASQAMSQGHKAGESMKRLLNSSQSIGKVLDVINSVADRTNLLALNATIEAAFNCSTCSRHWPRQC